MTAAASRWLMNPRPLPNARLRLYCFPYAGAGASAFVPWAQQLAPTIEVIGVQPPGRESRIKEPPIANIDVLADAMFAALQSELRAPFAFFGHSSGALMAFELTRRLRSAGLTLPVHLFASARIAPQVPAEWPPVHALPDDQFVDVLRNFAGTPEEVLSHPELMRLILPTMRADFSLGDTYVYRAEPPLDVPIMALGGAHDPRVSHAGVMAWKAQTTRPFSVAILPGDHFFLNTASSMVLECIREGLAGVRDA